MVCVDSTPQNLNLYYWVDLRREADGRIAMAAKWRLLFLLNFASVERSNFSLQSNFQLAGISQSPPDWLCANPNLRQTVDWATFDVEYCRYLFADAFACQKLPVSAIKSCAFLQERRPQGPLHVMQQGTCASTMLQQTIVCSQWRHRQSLASRSLLPSRAIFSLELFTRPGLAGNQVLVVVYAYWYVACVVVLTYFFRTMNGMIDVMNNHCNKLWTH